MYRTLSEVIMVEMNAKAVVEVSNEAESGTFIIWTLIMERKWIP